MLAQLVKTSRELTKVSQRTTKTTDPAPTGLGDVDKTSASTGRKPSDGVAWRWKSGPCSVGFTFRRARSGPRRPSRFVSASGFLTFGPLHQRSRQESMIMGKELECEDREPVPGKRDSAQGIGVLVRVRLMHRIRNRRLGGVAGVEPDFQPAAWARHGGMIRGRSSSRRPGAVHYPRNAPFRRRRSTSILLPKACFRIRQRSSCPSLCVRRPSDCEWTRSSPIRPHS